MNSALTLLSWLLMISGLLFFISGSMGLLRFPDVFCRLHAVTKADTMGLGLMAIGLACRASSLHTGLLLLFVWLVVIASGAVSCLLLARFSRDEDAPPQHAQDGNG